MTFSKPFFLGGLDADVGERGRHFSVGQRQLMCLARALLTRSKVNIFGENSEEIDPYSLQLRY